MKKRNFLSNAISLILIFSMCVAFTSCSESVPEPLADNFVEYVDPTNGVSYTYNNAYVLSLDNPADAVEIGDYSSEFYTAIFKDRSMYLINYPNAQYYLMRNEKNKIESTNATFVYTIDGRTLRTLKMNELTEEDYKTFSNSIRAQLEKSLGTTVTDDTTNQFVTFGDNQYMHVKCTFSLDETPYVYEQFLFQLEDGNVGKFVYYTTEGQYDFGYTYAVQVLESFKAN